MTFKASARSALILATGLFVFSAGQSQAAVGTDDASASSKSATATGAPTLHKNLRHGWRHRKSYAHRRSHRLALKVDTETKAATADAIDGNVSLSDIPPSVANANAQLRSPGMPGDDAKPAPPPANGVPQYPDNAKSDNGIVAADQLNDVDRALQEGSNTPAALSAMASANPPPAPTAAPRRESSLWEQTSLIGKIFIGFGALLTMASAARMFMA